jgi:hypothetical protein
MTANGEPESDEERRLLQELSNKLDKEARKRTKAISEPVSELNRMILVANHLKVDAPGKDAAVAEVEKRREEIEQMWEEVDRITALLHAQDDVPSYPVNDHDPDRRYRRKTPLIPRTPEARAKMDVLWRQSRVIDKLEMTLMAHRMALAELEAKGAEARGATADVEKHREDIKEAIQELETEIKRRHEIISPGSGEDADLVENWREILSYDEESDSFAMAKWERDLILERARLSLTPEQSAKVRRVVGGVRDLEEKWYEHERAMKELGVTPGEVEKHENTIMHLKAEIERVWESRYA